MAVDTLKTQAPTPPLIEFEDATVFLRNNKALDSISLRIGLGENVAIIGPNGSGKSTLIKAITRECYPLARDEGPAVRIMGESMWEVAKLRLLLGIVSGSLQQICDQRISGYEMVLSGFFGSIGVCPFHRVTPAMETRARELLEFLEITRLAQKPMTEMSTGEARRVLIGRALVHKPKALILDEPANGLDPNASRRFAGTIRRIASSGKSIILVTHLLQDIIPEINRVIMIRDGQVFRDGVKDEILTKENLSELFRMPVEVLRKDGFYQLWA